jgi:hypothetical protein
LEVIMQRAKAFFYVCAGIFLLALSYHLGARKATAQAVSNPVTAALGATVATANGDFYGTNMGAWTRFGNIFSSAGHTSTGPIAAMRMQGAAPVQAITSDGDVYSLAPGPLWTFEGNMFSGSTPAARTSWGQLKGTYRK